MHRRRCVYWYVCGVCVCVYRGAFKVKHAWPANSEHRPTKTQQHSVSLCSHSPQNLLKLNAILSTDNHMHTRNGHTYKWAEKAAVFIDK